MLLQQVAWQYSQLTRLNRQKFHSTSLLTRLGELSELFRDFASEWFWRTNKEERFINVLTTASHSNLYKRHFLHKNFDAIITQQEQKQLKKWSHFKHLLAEHAEFLILSLKLTPHHRHGYHLVASHSLMRRSV